MKLFSNKKAVVFVAVLALAFMNIAAAKPAANTGLPDNGTNVIPADRIIDRTSDKIPVDKTATKKLQELQQKESSSRQSVTVRTPIPLPNGVELGTGEVVQVNYSDGVVTHQAVAATCAVTSSVQNPTVANGSARASHSYGLSSGCSETTSVNGILSSYAAPWWHQRSFKTTSVRPGITAYWVTSKTCVNTSSRTWHAENAVGSSVVGLTPDVNLACNPG
ncbi:hypothetical protein E3T39_00945 [Cryobacterium suzukii]|uniref:Uncharacterized protein n=1 Tax=Cryobacterium suzukii TaxID=1259198 RepID=A0A4R9AHT2_9MICO|nr:hypothetical protein [Cryobacterium suzukii]TFD62550.1 hypothetical protein E3T39_00945 [Cryobacterium suzukii]